MIPQDNYRQAIDIRRCEAVALFAEWAFTRAYRDDSAEGCRNQLATRFGLAVAEVKPIDGIDTLIDISTAPRVACNLFIDMLRVFIDEKQDMNSSRVQASLGALYDLGYLVGIDPRLIDLKATDPAIPSSVSNGTYQSANAKRAASPRRGLGIFDPNSVA